MLERIMGTQRKPWLRRGRLDTNQRIIKQNEFKKFIAPSTLAWISTERNSPKN